MDVHFFTPPKNLPFGGFFRSSLSVAYRPRVGSTKSYLQYHSIGAMHSAAWLHQPLDIAEKIMAYCLQTHLGNAYPSQHTDDKNDNIL